MVAASLLPEPYRCAKQCGPLSKMVLYNRLGAQTVRAARVFGASSNQATGSKGWRFPSYVPLACVTGITASMRHRHLVLPKKSLVRLASSSAATLAPPAESAFFRDEGRPSIELATVQAPNWSGDAMVLFLRARKEGEDTPVELGRAGEAVDKELGGIIREFVDDEAFEAKEGAAKMLRIFGKAVKRVIVVGLGAAEKSKCDWRLAGAAAAGLLKEMKRGTAGVVCVDGVQVQALVEGLLMALHKDQRFRGSKTSDKDKVVSGPTSIDVLGAFPPGSGTAIDNAKAIASGIIFARELVNAAPNVVTPPTLASAAEDLAGRLGLKVKILEESDCEALGMGSFLAVGRASDLPAKLIHLTYTPSGEVSRKVGIVGKGLTFDSGGYNLKAGAGSMIEMMKFDMGGAAATLGTAAAIAQLKPKQVEVHFIIATCENMISGNPGALRPGDIITAMDGTTIEVNNTDAEGRLTLADALLYCQEQGVTEVIDIATLTGACIVALGQEIAGMWSNSDELAGQLDAASKATGEKMWRMPLEDGYFEGLKSDFADMKNTGPRWGGSITAALFLKKFIKDGMKWAHLDIAGTVWAEKPKGPNPVGGTGSMVRTLTEHLTHK